MPHQPLPWTLQPDGTLAIPDTPRLGISLDPDRVAKDADTRVSRRAC